MIELNKIYNEDCLIFLKKLSDNSIDCCVTSPPYYGLRDYGVDGQIGFEKTPELYVEKLVQIFFEVRRVLKKEGTLWLNLGDSYAGSGKGGQSKEKLSINWQPVYPHDFDRQGKNSSVSRLNRGRGTINGNGLKPKDLIGIPWMIAFALRADGWYLRQDIIWHKPNPMPESVTDRCTKAHEYIFLLSKSAKYYYDYKAISEKANYNPFNTKYPDGWDTGPGSHGTIHRNGREKGRKIRKNDNTNYGGNGTGFQDHSGYNNLENPYVRNKRDVWTITTKPYKEAHFAVYPEKLIVDCIKAGCPEEGIVLDPFMGAGTTALVCIKLNRNYLGCELHADYCQIAEKRLEPYLMQQIINFK